MVVNFRAREISWGIHKLIRTPTLIKKYNTTKTSYNILACAKKKKEKNRGRRK
jgi:hypothetical protein